MIFTNRMLIRNTSFRCFPLLLLLCFPPVARSQKNQQLYKVLTLTGQKQGAADLPQDRGTTGVWQCLLKLQSTGSVLHTQAHPDDEHADLLTYLGRGVGARTALLSLNRGESGGNVLGYEFFDPLGLLRTEEFLLASSYYGLDDLYFTRLVDYGFSKNVEEAYEKWGKQNILAEMVRVIRINRPLVIISRFHGSIRDGHGNHQAAGEVSQLAFKLAGDSTAFPEQITSEGLRPWQPLKLYRGGVKENERWHIALNTGMNCPWLGESYKNFAALGYSLHRSQTGGQRNEWNGSFIQYYERVESKVNSSEKENSFFEGIDTTLSGIFTLSAEKIPEEIRPLLNGITSDIKNAVAAFNVLQPVKILPYLTGGLKKIRQAMALVTAQRDALFLLQVKEKQFIEAINLTLGIRLEGTAMAVSAKEQRSFFAPPPTMDFAVPGRPFKIEMSLLHNATYPVNIRMLQLNTPAGWKTELNKEQPAATDEKVAKTFIVTIAENTPPSAPYFYRNSLRESQYDYTEVKFQNLPRSASLIEAIATYVVDEEQIQITQPVQVRHANLPFGYDRRTLKAAPAIVVNISPRSGVIPINTSLKAFMVNVELINNSDTAVSGKLQLATPYNWKVTPGTIPFSFTKAGEINNFSFKIFPVTTGEKEFDITATAISNGISYSQGYDNIKYRDLDNVLYLKPAHVTLKGINVKVHPGLRIGYIMGVGDEVPAGLLQLGAQVQLLNTNDLATGNLNGYDVIMVGTRAYAVRKDLTMYNQRLLTYAKEGGHVIVLFQTPEFIPSQMAPYDAKLPANPEEVAEENSIITILQPRHPVFTTPNLITSKDFENWVEQRGSKFFSEWNPAYTAMIATNDRGQSPQSGGWLMAKYGKGNYTYFAYSFHRQLPNGVTGAYRILANLISYGKKPATR
ncbi:MAG TPA: PIG-L family deacetylase [Flavitalea sp.]|nr:PIG-L family deacetylase [Flavitalea sp.]